MEMLDDTPMEAPAESAVATDDVEKTGWPTADICGMELPVIADLGDGWFLVAHRNGAAIANQGFLSVLWTEAIETKLLPDDPYDVGGPSEADEAAGDVPEAIRRAAVEQFERFAWPLVRGQFYPA